MLRKSIVACAALITALAPAVTVADTVESVEGARAKERQGRWLNHDNREALHRWGGNDDYDRYDYRYERDDYGYDRGAIRYYRAYPR
jgi:opacity protein-like surface antigen